MSIYSFNSNYKFFEDYVLSINTILNFKIVLIDNTSIINVKDDIAIFMQEFPVNNIDFVNSNKQCQFIIINMEQLSIVNFFNIIPQIFSIFSQLCKDNCFVKEPIFGDYSLSNLNLIKDLSFKKVYLPYIIHEEELIKLKNYMNVDKEYDIGIVEYVNCYKRDKIVNELRKRNYKINICKGWKDERDIEIGKCKILINIHYADNYQIFENIRCDRWIFSGMKVFSETSINKMNYGVNFKEVNYDNIVTDIDNFINQNINIDDKYYQNEIEFRKNMIRNILN